MPKSCTKLIQDKMIEILRLVVAFNRWEPTAIFHLKASLARLSAYNWNRNANGQDQACPGRNRRENESRHRRRTCCWIRGDRAQSKTGEPEPFSVSYRRSC